LIFVSNYVNENNYTRRLKQTATTRRSLSQTDVPSTDAQKGSRPQQSRQLIDGSGPQHVSQ